jgi:tRNA threonylcarbamoyladenosine biosynthesis protein TsaB
MLTLGIETSGRAGSVALVEGGQLLRETVLSQTGRRHARTLVAELKALFEAVNRKPDECGCAAVSVGPGSFTGLRVGVVCAKTFAYAVGCAVVGVDTLEAIAATAPAKACQVDVVMDAQRGELFVGRYARRAEPGAGSIWSRDEEIAIVSAEAFLSERNRSIPITGPAAAFLGEIDRSLIIEDCLPTAAQVAFIGEREAEAGRADDMWTLEPRYVRKSAAEEKAAHSRHRS